MMVTLVCSVNIIHRVLCAMLSGCYCTHPFVMLIVTLVFCEYHPPCPLCHAVWVLLHSSVCDVDGDSRLFCEYHPPWPLCHAVWVLLHSSVCDVDCDSRLLWISSTVSSVPCCLGVTAYSCLVSVSLSTCTANLSLPVPTSSSKKGAKTIRGRRKG